MERVRSYSDDQLIAAVAGSTSWRGLLRELGLMATSAGAMRSVRARADRLGVDYSHFRGRRRWDEHALRAAISTGESWDDVAEKLDVQGPGAVSVLKGHALRLHIDIGHLAEPPEGRRRVRTPDTAHLRKAGPLLAAAWFTLCGEDVSWPLEPCRYDLLVSGADGIRRIQVKTTTVRAGDSWKAYLSTTRGQRRPYDPDEIDEFFVIDPDMTYYLIPVASVGGLHAIHLSAYQEHRLPHLGS